MNTPRLINYIREMKSEDFDRICVLYYATQIVQNRGSFLNELDGYDRALIKDIAEQEFISPGFLQMMGAGMYLDDLDQDLVDFN